MQVLRDLLRSLISWDHNTAMWLSNKRFEKLLCTPVRAASLFICCCTFINFVRVSSINRSDRTLCGGRSSALLPCGTLNLLPMVDAWGSGHWGRDHLPPLPGWVQGPKVLVDASTCCAWALAISSLAPAFTQWVLVLDECFDKLTDSRKVVIPKLT